MKIKMIFIVITFFATLIGANIYLANRFAWFFSINSSWPLYILFPLITVFMIFGVMGLINSTSTWASIIFNIAAITMGLMLYLLITVIAIDILNIFLKINPKVYGLLAISIAMLISIYGIWNAAHFRTKVVDIPTVGLSKPVVAAHLTDTHIGHIRGAKALKKIVSEINNQNVEVVFFTGDLLDSKIQLKPESLAPLKDIKAPVFFVEGNHDVYTGTNQIKDYLRNININVLTNEIKYWNGIQIIGLDHMVADSNSTSPHASSNGPNIKNMLKQLKIDSEMPSVLLHHSPDGIKYAAENNINLYLAGHTHGGQLWPITIFAKLMFEVNKGLHKVGNTQVYVSQGTGTFGPPMRVGTYGELTILNLIPK